MIEIVPKLTDFAWNTNALATIQAPFLVETFNSIWYANNTTTDVIEHNDFSKSFMVWKR